MRKYYARDKRRREDAKKKQREEKRLKRLNKSSTIDPSQQTTESGPGESSVAALGQEEKQ